MIWARMSLAHHDSPVTILNLSLGGIGLRTDCMIKLRPGETVSIACAELGEVACIVRWSGHPNYGLEFGTAAKKSAIVRAFYGKLPPAPEQNSG